MAEFVIDRADDPRLADFRQLRDVSLRKHLEAEQGLFIAEGAKVIRRSVEAGYRPRSFLLAPRWLDSLRDILARHPEVDVFVVSEAVAEDVTGFHVHRGALGSMYREVRHTVSDLLGFRRLIVLEDLVDHTNVGAVLRSAAGLGWDGALLAPRCADPLYRRSIKVSMGAVFSLPWARLPDWSSALSDLGEAGFTTVALALRPDAQDLATLAPTLDESKVALIVGTEGAGLSERWLATTDVVAKIPMSAGIDSLNVAAATAIGCYALRGPS